jgi:hypothetical protein
MSTQRTIALETDDPGEAFRELQARRATGEAEWDVDEVQRMEDPPHTAARWCVFSPRRT